MDSAKSQRVRKEVLLQVILGKHQRVISDRGLYWLSGISDTQLLTIALAAAPTMLTVWVGILINRSRVSDLSAHVDARFDDMRDVWRSELHRWKKRWTPGPDI